MASFDSLLGNIPPNIADLPLKHWNKGVFDHELIHRRLVADDALGRDESGVLSEGTWNGTQLALTEMFDRVERGFGSFFDFLGIEPSIPRPIPFEQKKTKYNYQPAGKDGYPPHLDSIPSEDQVSIFEIYDKFGLAQSALLLPNIVPKSFLNSLSLFLAEKFRDFVFGDPESGLTIAEVVKANRDNRKSGTDIMRGANIVDYDDWYSDARFGQQQFTGVDPTTITCTTKALDWISRFRGAAEAQDLPGMIDIIKQENASSLLIQDYSYFREAMKISDAKAQIMINLENEDNRYGCAAVCLFRLGSDGRLHPLAVVIDYKGSMGDSVVIFNERVSADDPKKGESWAWRYAKTAVQTSAWTKHELTSHLTHTHFIEEAIIVATHRMIPPSNIIFQLLEPHWFRTLSLNAAARETLVPKIIFDLVGYSHEQSLNFIDAEYYSFQFQGKYVPNDLDARGFSESELRQPNTPYVNYAYGRNMLSMWGVIKDFVQGMIALKYQTDAQVAADTDIENWYKEIRSDTGAQIPSFPEIKTVAELVDAVTMCIHIASPQHTAVNYLQAFYQTFVINRPPCLYTPLPTTLAQLQAFTEADLIKALPIGRQRAWLLAAHIPWLLSFRPTDDNNLINYAASLWNLYRRKGPEENGPAVTEIAKTFYERLRGLIVEFQQHSGEMTPGTIPYTVMDPNETAISILA